MTVIPVRTESRNYRVLVGSGLLRTLGTVGRRARPHPGLALVVCDPNTRRYASVAAQSLRGAGFSIAHATVPAGERAKSLREAGRLWNLLARRHAGRDTLVVAVGGGVVGDLAGFVAAGWNRGVDVLQVPTTLLAMVDASVGGKTGINLRAGKNLVGTFHQPVAVVADLDALRTLPDREFRAGLAEVVKYALIGDAPLFGRLERGAAGVLRRDAAVLRSLVARCVAHKARVVGADEREGGPRMLLNLGHTFGHAIEAATRYRRYLHGEAVAIGLAAAARLSERAGVSAPGLEDRVRRLLDSLGLPGRAPGLRPDRLRALAASDKKALRGRLRFVVCSRVGRAEVRGDLPAPAVAEAWEACVAGAAQ